LFFLCIFSYKVILIQSTSLSNTALKTVTFSFSLHKVNVFVCNGGHRSALGSSILTSRNFGQFLIPLLSTNHYCHKILNPIRPKTVTSFMEGPFTNFDKRGHYFKVIVGNFSAFTSF
jgi:hypothetical protein